MTIDLNDRDILLRLPSAEDSTVERKTASDYRDCLKTAVAFSNSLPVDDPGIIFVGVGNDGTVQENTNVDSLQMKITAELTKIYPPIYPQMKAMRTDDSKEFLAIIVRGSANRPHFAGPSFIRKGSQSVVASEEQFERLIVQRTSLGREFEKMRGNQVTWRMLGQNGNAMGGGQALLLDYNESFVTIDGGTFQRCFPRQSVRVSFDPKNKMYELIVLVP